jgi:hypothetical protein
MAAFMGPDVSKWQDERAERNRRSLVRLTKALPPIFPSAVLSRALSQRFIPPTPRLAIDSSWRAHPLRADRLARALAAKTGPPVGWKADQPKPQNRVTRNIPNAAGSVPRASLQLGSGFLLRLRTTRLQTWLAQGPLECRAKHECGMALCLRYCLAVVERTEQRGSTPAPPARAALRPNR